ncbi:MAG TPA: hypothetical protein PLV83_00300 [Bacilli bacterium]|nr:hypothetical protein [Bacilli bacterium]
MNSKLPKVYANKNVSNINNNKKVFYSDKNEIRNDTKPIYKENINSKINKLFKSTKYVYKINVEIETSNGKQIEKIIGKNSSNLITIDNKLIPISSIIDIKEI